MFLKKLVKKYNHNRTYYDNLVRWHRTSAMIGAIIGVILYLLDAVGLIHLR